MKEIWYRWNFQWASEHYLHDCLCICFCQGLLGLRSALPEHQHSNTRWHGCGFVHYQGLVQVTGWVYLWEQRDRSYTLTEVNSHTTLSKQIGEITRLLFAYQRKGKGQKGRGAGMSGYGQLLSILTIYLFKCIRKPNKRTPSIGFSDSFSKNCISGIYLKTNHRTVITEPSR